MPKPLAFLLAALGLSATAQAATDPQAALQAILNNQRGGSMRATLTMIVERPGAAARKLVLDLVGDGADRGLIVVKSPAREAGQAFLKDGPNLTLYSPAFKRVMRLPPSAGSDSFLGSDLSYGDLAGRDMQRDFTPQITSEGGGTLTLTLTPLPDAPTPYGRVEIVARSGDYAPEQITYFDQRNQAVRRISLSDYQTFNKRLFPTTTTVEDLLKGKNRTTLKFGNVRLTPVPSACFTQQALESGC